MATKPTPPKRGPGAAPKTNRIRSTNASRIEDRRSPTTRSLDREVESQRGVRVTKSANPPRPSQEMVRGGLLPTKKSLNTGKIGPNWGQRTVPKNTPLTVNPSTGAVMRQGYKGPRGVKTPPYRPGPGAAPQATTTHGPPKRATSTRAGRKKS